MCFCCGSCSGYIGTVGEFKGSFMERIIFEKKGGGYVCWIGPAQIEKHTLINKCVCVFTTGKQYVPKEGCLYMPLQYHIFVCQFNDFTNAIVTNNPLYHRSSKKSIKS